MITREQFVAAATRSEAEEAWGSPAIQGVILSVVKFEDGVVPVSEIVGEAAVLDSVRRAIRRFLPEWVRCRAEQAGA